MFKWLKALRPTPINDRTRSSPRGRSLACSPGRQHVPALSRRARQTLRRMAGA